MPRGGLLRLVYVALAWLCAGARSQTQFLTIGAPPVEMSAPPGTYVRFTIDIVNDYCAKAAVQARNLCMGTISVRVHVQGCVGESWLLTNPTKTWQPTISNTEFLSNNGNTTTFTEESAFDVTQSTTHVAVYNPGIQDPTLTSYFQIWVVNVNDPEGAIETISPFNRPGAHASAVGQLLPSILLSGSIYIPSQIQLDWYYANRTNASGAYLPDEELEFRLFYNELGPVGTSTDMTKHPQKIMASACGVLRNGIPVGNWTNSSSARFTLGLDGGVYQFNVLARPRSIQPYGVAVNWREPNCTSPCLVGAYQALPYTWIPYKPVKGTDTSSFETALGVLLTGLSLLGCVILAGFWHVHEGAQRRLEAQELVELQQQRRAAIERGEKYHIKKKRRQLTLWERLTGEIVTKEDEEYDDCLNAEERRKIEQYHRSELGAEGEFDRREIPGV